MRIVLQRVTHAKVSVNGEKIAEIGRGLLILVGVGPDDDEAAARFLAEKSAYLRIFEDEDGKTNRSVKDIQGEALVVSQFTLYADTRKGRRPSFINAAPPELAAPLVEYFARVLTELGVPSQLGEFGAYMQVELVNDGPMTIVIER